MPLQSASERLSVENNGNVSMSHKSARSSTTMREDDCFLSVVAADLDSFCTRNEYFSKNSDNGNRPAIIVFPSVDCRHRRLIHSLIGQRYQTLAHASVGVEPDRRPIAIYRDFLLKVVLPTRFKQIQNGNGNMAHSEFAFCLALLEACRDSGEAKRFIERLYAFRLADQRIVSPRLSSAARQDSFPDSIPAATPASAPASSAKSRVKPGCERYVPRPMRQLQEQQKKVASDQKAVSVTSIGSAGKGSVENNSRLPKSSTSESICGDLQRLKLSSFEDDSNSPGDSPLIESRRALDFDSNTPLGTKPGTARHSAHQQTSNRTSTSLQRKPSVTSNSTNSNLMSMWFLGDFVGPSTNVVHLPVERYSAYRSEPPPLEYEALSHVIEISGFPRDWRGADLQRFLPAATYIHWVDDTHVLAVFRSANEAKAFTVPPEVCVSIEVRSMRNASVESKYKAYRIFDDLVSRLRKPQTSSAVVRRVLNHHLRLGLAKPAPPTPTATTMIPNNNITPTASPLVSGARRDT